MEKYLKYLYHSFPNFSFLQWLSIFLLVIGFHTSIQAQLPTFGGGGTGSGFGNIGSGGSSRGGSTGTPILQKDTLNIDARYDTIFFTTNRYTLQLGKVDTSIAQIHRYHPALNYSEFPYVHLGNIAQPHQPLVFEYRRKIGFNLGLRQFDAYQYEHEEVPYYQSQHPFSQIQYNIGPEEEQNFQVDFGLHPAKNFHLYLRYRSANVAGIYQHQRGIYRNFTGSVWYKHPKKRYQLLAHYLTNVVNSEQNGGVTEDANVTDLNEDKILLPVNLSTAANTIRKRGVFIQQTMDFGRRVKQKVTTNKAPSNRPPLPTLEGKIPTMFPKEKTDFPPIDSLFNSTLEGKKIPISPKEKTDSPPMNSLSNSTLERKKIPISPKGKTDSPPMDSLSNASLESLSRDFGRKKSPIPPIPTNELTDSLTFLPLPKDSLQDSIIRAERTTALLRDSLRRKPKQKVIEKFIPRGRVGYAFRATRNAYQYTDEQSAENASTYYNAFYRGDETDIDNRPALLTDTLMERTLQNEVFLMWIGDREKKGRKIRRNARAGLVHQATRLTQAQSLDSLGAGVDTTRRFTTGLLNFQVENDVEKSSRRFSYLLKAQYALFGFNVGDFNAEARMHYPIAPKLGNLQLKGSIKNLEPDYVQNRWFGHYFNWDNDFRKTRSLQLEATYENPDWQLEVSARTQVFDNFIVWDSLSLPRQLSTEFGVNQFVVKKGFQFLRKFQFDHTSAVQLSSSDFVRLPTYWTFNSLYYQGWVFNRAARIRLGVDVYYNTNYFANAYNPATGQFFLQNDTELEFYPVVDAYLNVKVQRVRLFLKMQHLNQALIPGLNNGYFDVLHYPMPDRALKFGVKWMFFD